jgi:hypothetical protein
MPEVWIDAARQQVRVVCNHDAVLWNDYDKAWCALRSEDHESATDDMRAQDGADRVQYVAAVN